MITNLCPSLDACEPGIGHVPAELRVDVIDLEAQISRYSQALTQPRALRDAQWAKALRKAIKLAHYQILELEAA